MSKTRNKNRLKNKELYQTRNYFFITICTKNRECLFGDVVVGEKFISPCEDVDSRLNQGELKFAPTVVKLSQFGSVTREVWLGLPVIFANITIEDFVIMPNHIHGIIGFVGTPISKMSGKTTDLSKIIKYFKAKTTLKIKNCVGEKFISPLEDVDNQSNQGELKFAPTALNYSTFLFLCFLLAKIGARVVSRALVALLACFIIP